MEEKEILKEEQDLASVQTATVAAELTEDELHGENLNERVKTLSPTMTVLKRFFRSKLSMTGLIILLALFLFSFVGPRTQYYRSLESRRSFR